MSAEPEVAVRESAAVSPACSVGGLSDICAPGSAGVSPAHGERAPALFPGSLLQEIALARDIQRAQIPKQFPGIPGFGLAGFSISARHLAGDYFDALPVARGKVLLAVADVMGKGVPAALFTGTLRPLLRTMLESTLDPAGLLARLNRLLYQELEAVDVFITVQLAMVDTNRDRMTVASAGHCPLLLCDQTGGTKAISPDGIPLGILPNATFKNVVLPLGDCWCASLFTDGLLDAFGRNRLTHWMERTFSRDQTASELCAGFRAELQSSQACVGPGDDQTLLILSREPRLE